MTSTPNSMRSNCCKAPMHVSTGDEGTSCYICTACRKPCDPLPTPPAKGEWEGEFFDRFVAVKEYHGRNQPAIYRKIFANEINLPFKVLDFIRSLRSQAYEEGKREAIEEVKHKAIEYGIDKRFIHELDVLIDSLKDNKK